MLEFVELFNCSTARAQHQCCQIPQFLYGGQKLEDRMSTVTRVELTSVTPIDKWYNAYNLVYSHIYFCIINMVFIQYSLGFLGTNSGSR